MGNGNCRWRGDRSGTQLAVAKWTVGQILALVWEKRIAGYGMRNGIYGTVRAVQPAPRGPKAAAG